MESELITPEGVELWRFSSGDGEVEVAHREHAAGHVSVYKTTEEKCVSDSDDDDESFEAPYYGTLSDNQTSISKTTSIDVVRCEGGHFLAETSGYFFVDFSSHVSGIDKSAAALSTNEDLKIWVHLFARASAVRRYGATFGSVILMHLVMRRKRRVLGAKFDAAARLPGTLTSPPAGSLGIDAISDTIIRLNASKRVPGSRKNPKVTLDAFANETERS